MTRNHEAAILWITALVLVAPLAILLATYVAVEHYVRLRSF